VIAANKKAHDLDLDLAEIIVTLVRWVILLTLYCILKETQDLDVAEIIVTLVRLVIFFDACILKETHDRDLLTWRK
jgi:hypothetical protein